MMGTMRLKAPPLPSALAAIARTAGQPAPGSAAPPPASAKPAKAKRLPPAEFAAVKFAEARALPKKTPEARALPKKTPEQKQTAQTVKRVALIRLTKIQHAEALKQQAAWREADAALCRLHFPGLFNPDRPLPLADGARKPIAALVGIMRARRFLVWWTARPEYLAAIAAGGTRYSLDGRVVGEISASQRDEAQAKLLKTALPQPEREAA